MIAKELIPAPLRTEAAGVPPQLVPHVNLGRDDAEPHLARAIVAPEFARLAHEFASRFGGAAHETCPLNTSPRHGFLDLCIGVVLNLGAHCVVFCFELARRCRQRDIELSKS